MNVIQTNLKYRNTLIPLNLSNIQYLVIHHTECSTATPEQIHSWHLQNAWDGFGYNEYIRKDGTVYIGRGDNVGAHCKGYNSVSYGICCEGNYDSETYMPETQKQSLIERIQYNKSRLKCKSVVPHRALCSTNCPGKYFPLEEVLKKVEIINIDWKEILKQKTDSPERWIKAIESVVNFAKATDVNIGDLEVLQHLPTLIEKVAK